PERRAKRRAERDAQRPQDPAGGGMNAEPMAPVEAAPPPAVIEPAVDAPSEEGPSSYLRRRDHTRETAGRHAVSTRYLPISTERPRRSYDTPPPAQRRLRRRRCCSLRRSRIR